MRKRLSTFKKFDNLNNVFSARRDELRCTAIRLQTGGLCLFSPVQGLCEEAISSLASLGDVEFLLAPNHYHTKGLKEYAQAFPKAYVCAPVQAHARLEKITSLRFEDLTGLQAELLPSMGIVAPLGLKTGEIWITANNRHHKAWIVVDAFAGPKGKQEDLASAPEILGSFPRMGIANRTLYLDWLEQKIQTDNPTMIVPCHGSVLHNSRMEKCLRGLLRAELAGS